MNLVTTHKTMQIETKYSGGSMLQFFIIQFVMFAVAIMVQLREFIF